MAAKTGIGMTRIGKTDGLVVGGLLLLSAIPLVAGAFRIAELVGGAAITAENARFVAAPIPVLIHIVGSALFCVLGAFQFSPSLRRARPRWHRLGGRVSVPMGFAAALSGLWMTEFYPWVGYDGTALYVIRLIVGCAMVLSLGLAVAAIRRRDIPSHFSWMTRAYALGIGAGTQAFTHIPGFVFPDIQGELARTVSMAAGWAINMGVAEWVILRLQHASIQGIDS